MKDRNYGFTLIEIVIALAIVGLLAAIAVPKYGTYLRDSRRTDAHIALQGAAQEMERCRTQNNFTYVNCSPKNMTSESSHYTLEVLNRTATAYELKATADTAGAQAHDTGCTEITLNSRGIMGPADGDCW